MKLNTVRGLSQKFAKYSMKGKLVCLSYHNRAYWMFTAEDRKFIIKFDMQGHYQVYMCLPTSDYWFPIMTGSIDWHECYYSRFDASYVNRVINCYAREIGDYHLDYLDDEGYSERYYIIPVHVVQTDGTVQESWAYMDEDSTDSLSGWMSYYSYLYI